MTPEVAAGALDEGRLAQTANQIRQDIIEMLLAAGSGHSAGPLGMADVFTTLYFAVLDIDPGTSWRSTGTTTGPSPTPPASPQPSTRNRQRSSATPIVPCDYHETIRATRALAGHPGPAYLRFGRTKTPVFTTPDSPFQIGRAEVLRTGEDLAIIACGPLVYEALRAAEQLHADGVEARVINCHTIKPLDVATLSAAARETGGIVTVEEHQILGGLGGAVAEALAAHHPVPVEMVAMPDHFGESGSPGELLAKWGLTAPAIVEKAHRARTRMADR